jgi:hypothetical protein
VTLVVRRVRSLTISFPLACAHPSTVINTDTIFFDGSPVIFDGLILRRPYDGRLQWSSIRTPVPLTAVIMQKEP